MAVNEKPILFSAPMVRAILAGSKTQTRRVVKPQPGEGVVPHKTSLGTWNWVLESTGVGTRDPFRCPYGSPRDRLWVRESFRENYFGDAQPGTQKHAYMADWDGTASDVVRAPKWTPSIYMRPIHSRIKLEVAAVRIERLQDITGKEILAEGAVARAHQDQNLGKMPVSAFDGAAYVDLRSLWAAGWDAINGKRPGCAWRDNPWVWCVEFKRVMP